MHTRFTLQSTACSCVAMAEMLQLSKPINRFTRRVLASGDVWLKVVSDRPTEVTLQACNSQDQIKAVAFISPQDRLIQSGLPPTDRWSPMLLYVPVILLLRWI